MVDNKGQGRAGADQPTHGQSGMTAVALCRPDYDMTDLETPRLSLHAIDTAEGERIVARRAAAEDAWAEDFPFDGDVIGVTAFLRATAAHGAQRPFGCYRITRTADGKAIGGIGFKGQPSNGC